MSQRRWVSLCSQSPPHSSRPISQPFFPGALLILSSFYTRKEIAIRIAIMYSGNSLSNCFGGLIAAGVISGMEGLGGLRGWEWLCEFP